MTVSVPHMHFAEKGIANLRGPAGRPDAAKTMLREDGMGFLRFRATVEECDPMAVIEAPGADMIARFGSPCAPSLRSPAYALPPKAWVKAHVFPGRFQELRRCSGNPARNRSQPCYRTCGSLPVDCRGRGNT